MIENDLGIASNVRRWTQISKDCYNLGCRCSLCNIKSLISNRKCCVKVSVLELVRRFGKPVD